MTINCGNSKALNGNFVTDLTRDDFRILEDGKNQKVLDFYFETREINMAMLIDTSGSMIGVRPAATICRPISNCCATIAAIPV